MRVASWAMLGTLLAGCMSEAECQRRIRASEREALRDAPNCAFRADSLPDATCETDRRPLLTYYGVFCSSAPLDCLQDDVRLRRICFGSPADTFDTAPPDTSTP